MTAIQLELNLKNDPESEIKLDYMQKQLDEMRESMQKVRKKLFAEVGELRKICSSIQIENQELKKIMAEGKNERTQWAYTQGDYLFDVANYKREIC